MDNNEQVLISDLIKKYRKLKGMTQEQLCQAAGISISTLKKYENNDRNPKPKQLQKIADALQVSVNVFMPLEVKDMSDILSTLIQLDKESDLIWDFKRDSRRHVIPETISISFKDLELNKKLAEYIYLKKNAKTPQEKKKMDRLFMYDVISDDAKKNEQ